MLFNPLDLVRLHSGIKGMTPTLMRDVLQTSVDRSMVLSDIFAMNESELIAHYPTMKPDVATHLVQSTADSAEETLEDLRNKGFRLITIFDEQYPSQYAPFADLMPPLFYVFGDLQLYRSNK
jgi:predicted Rossmann fold nucleotide-binding protein DprA/Smf involved in DNA uptake